MCYSIPLHFKRLFKNVKNSLIALAILSGPNILFAQPFTLENTVVDSLKNILSKNSPDTSRVHAFYWLSRNITLGNTGEAIQLANEGLDLARKIKFPSGQIECMEALCFCYAITGSFEKGFSTAYEQMELSKKYDPVREVAGINFMALLYQKLGDDKESLKWAQKAYYHPGMKQSDPFTQWSAMFLLSQQQERMNNLDSSYHFATETLEHSKRYFPRQESWPMMIMARINSKLGKYDDAVNYCKEILIAVKKI